MDKIKVDFLGKSEYTRDFSRFLKDEFKKQDLVKKLNYGLQNVKLENWGAWIKFNDKNTASTIELKLSETDYSRFAREYEYIFDNSNRNSLFPIYKNVYMQIFSNSVCTDGYKDSHRVLISFFIESK
jgi:hypothetical protein